MDGPLATLRGASGVVRNVAVVLLLQLQLLLQRQLLLPQLA